MSIIRLILVVVLLLLNRPLSAQTPSREYMLKAVFLFNFTQFVEWPANSFDEQQSPLIIGILGENPFGNYLEETVQGEQTNGHEVAIRYCRSEEETKGCHILFINSSEVAKYKPVVNALKGKSVLTVSDAPDFSRQGGMIGFFTKENKIKLRINLSASEASGLTLSSKLLRLAEIVKSNETN